MREKNERGGGGGRAQSEYIALQPKDTEKEKKNEVLVVDGQLGTDPLSPQRGCQPSLSQYNTNQYAAPYRHVTTRDPRGAPTDDKL